MSAVPIVLADDTDDLRALLRLAVESDGGFTVVGEARTGVEAISEVVSTHPAAILLDLAMPVMDGLQAIPEIRAQSPDTKIVVLSAFDTSAMAREALHAGAHAYVQKGASPATITSTLRDVCGLREEGRLASATSPPPTLPYGSAVARPRSTGASASDVLALTAHEMRTPMTAILGAAEALELHWPDLDDGGRLELVRMVSRQAKRLDRLVDDLLVAGRLETGRLPIHIREVPVAPTLRSALELANVGEADTRIRCGDDVVALADGDRLRQVLVNFLVNAQRYGQPPIELTGTVDGGVVEIVVRDHGPGVGPDVVGRLFQRYSTGGATRGGIGLGLFIARELARAMGGDAAHSPGSPGAVFTVTLPAA